MKIAGEGRPLVAVLAVGSLAVAAAKWYAAAAVAALLALAVAAFFRDPERIPPADENAVVSPADGRVIEVAADGADGGSRVAVFLAVWNVHVNRAPFAGRVKDVRYAKGKFLAAFNPKAGLENERNRVEIESPRGAFAVTQVAGFIARRIVCRVKPGDGLARGGRFGLIQFGSRVDCEVPPGAAVCVKRGDHVSAGETVIARFDAPGGGRA
jgi:phosphatidylserine decarboxylase